MDVMVQNSRLAVMALESGLQLTVISSVIRIGRLPAVRRVDAGPTSRVRGGYASKARVAECLHCGLIGSLGSFAPSPPF